MTQPEIGILLEEGVTPPHYATNQAAGADIRAHLSAPLTLLPQQRTIVPTGVRLSIPEGYEVQVRPRSGLAAKSGVTVLNTPGTIDADYRGEIKVILINLSDEPFVIKPGQRIAQLIVAPVTQALFQKVETLTTTARGEGGFGHTGDH